MDRRKFLIGMGSLAAGSAAAMGTGAFTATELQDRSIGVTVTDDSQSLLALRAGEDDTATVSEYVYEQDGELVIDFSQDGAGVNPNSKYQLGDVPDDLDSESALDGEEPLENGNIEDNYAFCIINQSSNPQDIEVEVNMQSPPNNMELYLIAQNQDPVNNPADPEEALVAGAATPNNNWNTVLSFTTDSSGALGVGDEILVSLLIVRGKKGDESSSGDEWSGTMSVSAGENDDIMGEEELTDSTNNTST